MGLNLCSKFHIDPSVEMWLIVYSNDHTPLTVRPIYSSSKQRTTQMMIFSLVAMIGLEKCCITSACLQWLCHSGERTMARGPLVFLISSPEHEVLMVSYCGQSMSVLRRALFVVCRAATTIALKAYSSYTPGPIDSILGRKHQGDL